MKRRKVLLLPGCVYQNRNSFQYRCMGHATDGYVMQSEKGWTFTAHGIWQYEDGSIEWDYSTNGHWEEAKAV